MTEDRRQQAYDIRVKAAETARQRAHPLHEANSDEAAYSAQDYAMSFTKGLRHDPDTGLVADPADFEAFREAIDNGFIEPFTTRVPVPDKPTKVGEKEPDGRRRWEAPTAGTAFDLEGPDAQAVTMPPAPELGSKELAYEMAEVYELAILRDVSFEEWQTGSSNLTDSVGRLNGIGYDISGRDGRPRVAGPNGNLTEGTAFRGSSPGVEKGPYLLQFMLLGTTSLPSDKGALDTGGCINYGAQQIDQRVPVAKKQDYMTNLQDWLTVQEGFSTRDNTTLFDVGTRFIATPRDLATYVHDDALYQAYLNACLILLSVGAPFDPAFDALSGPGGSSVAVPSVGGHQRTLRQSSGFALYGGPHILTLVTEVATRALKAVRFQKYNNHLRLRPETLAGRIACLSEIKMRFPGSELVTLLSELEAANAATIAELRHNKGAGAASNAFLPMAFQEGSPMHPSYGAGHATVAGACVTVLKAFFDTGAVFATDGSRADIKQRTVSGDRPVAYYPKKDGSGLVQDAPGEFLTVEGELNKLAANISIGRNMAGVHYFSDYYDSVRMGEEIAIGLLEEQALTYPTDRFVFNLPTFDGKMRRIGRA